MRTAKRFNFRIPEDISNISFDEEPHSTYFTPALSTVWQPVYSMGISSDRILLHDINREEGTDLELRYEVFKTELVIRGIFKSI